MNTNLLNALKGIASRHGGVGILSDARRVKALLSDLAAGEPKPHKNALVACIEQGFVPALQNIPAGERGVAKAKLAERLNREEGLDMALCADTLDLLEAALFGTVSPKAAPPRASASKPPAPDPAQIASRILPKDLAEVFGAEGVRATFNAVHAFLQTCNGGNAGGRRERIARRIMLGDWIDLPYLAVQGDGGSESIDTENTDLGGNGKLLRLIVAGIDSFAATNKDAPAHIVFQFQNAPGEYRMNASATNLGGYRESEMRHYLTSKFLRGLVAAGAPEGVLYAPTRYSANSGKWASAADALADWLWLPTERELFGRNEDSNKTWETAANQARLEYYEGNGQRTKYNDDGAVVWWGASPYAGSATDFCYVEDDGTALYLSASNAGGCAPAFCVR
jgi:hypothetical protein